MLWTCVSLASYQCTVIGWHLFQFSAFGSPVLYSCIKFRFFFLTNTLIGNAEEERSLEDQLWCAIEHIVNFLG